ncbi:glycosyltransferase family 2 protein [Weissella coleopterorum]|uniref:Glycosyltransferase family 2 protein n=1 Tax=Weissella coleopterorum TaxID=2714949 RepID=A0A6G8AYB9_9LACO|nr:glycosyltransferase family 2 protein [Weissella coleopterorum]QIL49955.1 glycosyltransferase family 2 protein [Weissella coleopterorum]
MTENKKLAIVLPAYNEELVIEKTTHILLDIMDRMINDHLISSKSVITYVDDGSKDQTWSFMQGLHEQDSRIQGIHFSRNFGHQNALIAGLTEYTDTDFDYVVTLDADLQDDPLAIIEMVKLANSGKNIVYGVRNDRTTDSWFKRFSAQSFYKVMNILGVQTIPNHADFRLVDQKVLAAFGEYNERDMFLRGIFPSIGFNSAQVFYARKIREAGETKYPLKKMITFALDGITSFSVRPIILVRNLGLIMVTVSGLFLLYTLWSYFWGNAEDGWPMLMVSIWAIGGLQLLAIGIVGEYIGKIFMEVKHRPRYIIEKYLK